MLFDEGILGIISYLGIFVSAYIKFLKKTGDAMVIACAGSVIAYFFHNLFCYQQILCTPMIFIIMALGIWRIREHAVTEENKK